MNKSEVASASRESAPRFYGPMIRLHYDSSGEAFWLRASEIYYVAKMDGATRVGVGDANGAQNDSFSVAESEYEVLDLIDMCESNPRL